MNAVLLGVLLACGSKSGRAPVTNEVPAAETLATVKSFQSIGDEAARSRALFIEMARVFRHPRCSNCHPVDDTPRQGLSGALHEPPVFRGPDDHGLPAARCSTCHQDHNVPGARIPGAPHWGLAPRSMGWIGLPVAAICAQLKDPQRNGGRSLDAIHEHVAEDPLVAWGWSPGPHRQAAPGSQQTFADLTRAWIDSGAHCPESP